MKHNAKLIAVLKDLHSAACDLASDDSNEVSAYLLGYADAIQGTITLLESAGNET